MSEDENVIEKVHTYWEMAIQDDHHASRQGLASLRSEIEGHLSLTDFTEFLKTELDVVLPMRDHIASLEERHGVVLLPMGPAIAMIAEATDQIIREFASHANPGFRYLAAATTNSGEIHDLLVSDPCALVRCMVAAKTYDHTEWYLQILYASEPFSEVLEFVDSLLDVSESISNSQEEKQMNAFKNYHAHVEFLRLKHCPCTGERLDQVTFSSRFAHLDHIRTPEFVPDFAPCLRQFKPYIWGTQPLSNSSGEFDLDSAIVKLTRAVPDHYYFDYSNPENKWWVNEIGGTFDIRFTYARGDVAFFFRKTAQITGDPQFISGDGYHEYLEGLNEVLKNIPGEFSTAYKRRKYLIVGGYQDHEMLLGGFASNAGPVLFARKDDNINNDYWRSVDLGNSYDAGNSWEDIYKFLRENLD